jgi:hypothetical protein
MPSSIQAYSLNSQISKIIKSAIHDENLVFFTFLMEDLVRRNKPYNVIFTPLILHLFQTLRELGLQENQK